MEYICKILENISKIYRILKNLWKNFKLKVWYYYRFFFHPTHLVVFVWKYLHLTISLTRSMISIWYQIVSKYKSKPNLYTYTMVNSVAKKKQTMQPDKIVSWKSLKLSKIGYMLPPSFIFFFFLPKQQDGLFWQSYCLWYFLLLWLLTI